MIDDGVATNAVWLNANESLERQRFGGEHSLVIIFCVFFSNFSFSKFAFFYVDFC